MRRFPSDGAGSMTESVQQPGLPKPLYLVVSAIGSQRTLSARIRCESLPTPWRTTRAGSSNAYATSIHGTESHPHDFGHNSGTVGSKRERFTAISGDDMSI